MRHILHLLGSLKTIKKNQRKRSVNGRVKTSEVTKFSIGDFVLLSYPSRLPNKLTGLYRGPMIITSIDGPDIIQVRDLITNKLSMVHTSRLRVFRHPKEMTTVEAAALEATALDEFHVKSIMDHEGEGKDPRNGNLGFVGLDMSQKTILGSNRQCVVKDNASISRGHQYSVVLFFSCGSPVCIVNLCP